MKSIFEKDTINIIRAFTIECNRNAIVKTPIGFNPLDLVSSVITYTRENKGTIKIVVQNSYYRDIYNEYFNTNPAFTSVVYIVDDVINSNLNVTADLVIVDTVVYNKQLHNSINSNRILYICNYDLHMASFELSEANSIPQFVLFYKLLPKDADRYIKLDSYIIDKFRMFKSLSRHFKDDSHGIPTTPFDIIRYCTYGIHMNDVTMPYNKVCYLLAKEEGWNKDMIPNSITNKSIIENFHPDALHESARRVNEYIQHRSNLLSLNYAMLDTLNKLATSSNDVITAIHSNTIIAQSVTKLINSDFHNNHPYCLSVGNSLISTTLLDYDSNNWLLNGKGEIRSFGTTLQNRYAEQLSLTKTVTLFNTGTNVKISNVPSGTNKIVFLKGDFETIAKFEPNDLAINNLLNVGQPAKEALPHLKEFIWIVPEPIHNNGTDVTTKVYLDFVKLQANIISKRVVEYTELNHLTTS
jgi:hypothetical protein